MIRRGSNLLKNILDGEERWIDSFNVGDVVAPVTVTDYYFTGVVVDVDKKANKVSVKWNGGSAASQHDPDELEIMRKCRDGKVKTASMTDSEFACASAIRDAIIDEHNAVAVYEEIAQFQADPYVKTVAQSIAEEEKAHIGELTAILDYLNKNELESVNDGISETAEVIEPENQIPAVEIGTEEEPVEIIEITLEPVEELQPVPENVPVEGVDDAVVIAAPTPIALLNN